jgi:hypothetical protein
MTQEITPEVLYGTQEIHKESEDAILICSGYKNSDGEHEYLLISGMTPHDLTHVVDENIRDLKILDNQPNDSPQEPVSDSRYMIRLTEPETLHLNQFTSLLKGKNVTVWQYYSSSFPYMSLTKNLEIRGTDACLCFSRYGFPKDLDGRSESRYIEVTDIEYFKRTIAEKNWLGFDSQREDYQVTIHYPMGKITFNYDDVSRIEMVEPNY